MKNEYVKLDNKFWLKTRPIVLPQLEEGEKLVFNHNKLYSNKTLHSLDATHNLYFLSNEEIKDNDHILHNSNEIGQVQRCTNEFITAKFPNSGIVTCQRYNCKKIIASTDKSLTTGRYKSKLTGFIFCEDSELPKNANDEFKLITLPRPSNEFLKQYCEQGGIDEVLVEIKTPWSEASLGDSNNGVNQEYLKQKYSFDNKIELKVAPDNTITIRPVNERMYTATEVKVLCSCAFMRKDIGKGLPFDYTDDNLNEWMKNNI